MLERATPFEKIHRSLFSISGALMAMILSCRRLYKSNGTTKRLCCNLRNYLFSFPRIHYHSLRVSLLDALLLVSKVFTLMLHLGRWSLSHQRALFKPLHPDFSQKKLLNLMLLTSLPTVHTTVGRSTDSFWKPPFSSVQRKLPLRTVG